MANLNFEKLNQKIGDLLREISILKINLNEKEKLVLQKESTIRDIEETVQQLKSDLLFQQSANIKLREEKTLCEEELGKLKKKEAKKKVKAD
jgi:activator of HSP90 ATPase